jgi:hypothetical protein
MKTKTGLISLFLVFCIYSAAHSLTLSDIRFQVRRHLRDTPSTQDQRRYGDIVLTATINEVQREVVNVVHPITNTTTITLVAGTTYYQLPNDYIDATQAVWTSPSNEKIRLYQVSERVLVQKTPGYENYSGPPSEYMIRDSTYTATTVQVVFIPVPDSTSTGTVRIDYYGQVTDLSAGTDVPFNSLRQLYPYHDTLVFGTTARLKLREGDLQGAATFQALYEKSLKTMDERTGQKFDYNPSVSPARGR